MTRRVLQIRASSMLDGEDDDLLPLGVPSPLSEMERVADAVAAGDGVAAAEVLNRARQRLQQVAVDELHRLIGELVAEVALAQGLHEKVGRAILHGSRLLQSRPPDHIFQQFADPQAFVARCRAVSDYVGVFLAASLNQALAGEGLEPLVHPETVVNDMTQELTRALVATQEDGVDRRANLVRSVMAIVGAEGARGRGRGPAPGIRADYAHGARSPQ